jgi:hypothetical protein
MFIGFIYFPQVRRKYLIIPDKTNGFQVQDSAEAMLTEQVRFGIQIPLLLLLLLLLSRV